MRRIVIIITLFLLALATSLMVSNVTFAQEKPTAALAPMGALGELDEIEKRIFFNSLQESLSKYYTLTSQKMYEKAEEEAFQVMDADECTEDQCIAIIQELLQVEYFFMFEILQSGNFQQMKITRVDIDGNRDVRTTTCEDCNISKTNSKVDDLVQSVFKEFEIQKENVAVIQGTPTSQEAGASAYWEMIKDSNDKNKYKDFINRFPNSSIRPVAQIKLDEIIQKEKALADKKLAEQKRRREEEKRRKEEERKKKKLKKAKQKEFQTYWDDKKCKAEPPYYRSLNNYYGAEQFIILRPYGVNRINGKLVESSEEADRLAKNNNLVSNKAGGTIDYLRWPALLSLIFILPAYTTSVLSNTGCYETNKKDTVAKRFIKFNKFVMQEEFSKGKGDHLDAIYSILGCTHSVNDDLNKLIQMNYGTIYNKSTYPEIEARSIMFEVNKIINSDPWLMGHCNGYSPVNVVATREAEYLGIL